MYGKYYLESIRDAFVTQEWNQVFTGNRTRLKVVGLERMWSLHSMPGIPLEPLPNVTSLDMSFDPLADNRNVASQKIVLALAYSLPNLEEINLSHMIIGEEIGQGPIFTFLMNYCPSLQKFIWNGSHRAVSLEFIDCNRITQLHIDDSLLCSILDAAATPRAFSNGRRCMLSGLTNIVSLSIKNATWCEWEDRRGDFPRAFPVTQEMFIKMVRLHPTLRWLRSDLTEENIAMLKSERPEITFVSD